MIVNWLVEFMYARMVFSFKVSLYSFKGINILQIGIAAITLSLSDAVSYIWQRPY